MNRIIIVDDNPRDRTYLAELLSAYKPVCVANAAEALDNCKLDHTPWIITDIQMPDCNGIDLAKKIWNKFNTARILFWSQYSDETYVRALAKLIPADTVYGYVLKSNTSEVILRAAQTVFDDFQCWIDPQVRKVQARNQKENNLVSDGEYEVLIDIALGLTDNTIAERRFLSRRGVQNRLQSLYSKLGASDEIKSKSNNKELINIRARAIALALQRGLINSFELNEEETLLNDWLQSRK